MNKNTTSPLTPMSYSWVFAVGLCMSFKIKPNLVSLHVTNRTNVRDDLSEIKVLSVLDLLWFLSLWV